MSLPSLIPRGHIIYGIATNDGVATNLNGIPNDTVDRELLRLEQITRSGIEPVIHGLKLRPVPLHTKGGGSALVIEIPPGNGRNISSNGLAGS